MAGFQLWVNLPARDKLCAPEYRDIPPEAVPRVVLASGAEIRVIAGSSHGVAGAVTRPTTEPLVLDIVLPAGATLEQPVAAGHNAFVCVYGEAPAVVGDATVEPGGMAILANDAAAAGVRLGAGDAPARLLLVAGRPLGEPIAQVGPFVMNTQAELQQAFADFRAGRLAA